MRSPTKPIFVSGAVRSGTTWVGKTLALASNTFYVHEPFNAATASIYGMPELPYFGDLHSRELERTAMGALQNACGLSSNWADYQRRVQSARSWRLKLGNAVRFVKQHRRFAQRHRPVVKDPTALMASDWIWEHWRPDMLFLVRHPAAFVSSMKRVDWTLDFALLLDQPWLMEKYLAPYQEAMERRLKDGGDRLENWILCWNVFHHVITHYQQSQPDWLLVRHEDLSAAPQARFREIYQRFGLEYTAAIDHQVLESVSNNNPTEAPEGVMHCLARNSRANIKVWRHRLSEAEIARVREGTHELAQRYYCASDWEA